MATKLKNLSSYNPEEVPDASEMSFGIVVSEWNEEITEALYDGAYSALLANTAKPENIFKRYVPGSYELTLGSQFFAETKKVDAVIALGCVIQGETRHFDFICDAVANGIANVNIKYNIPVIFGVLTPDNQEQAKDRAGGKHGNKGVEAAITAIKMLALKKDLEV